MMGAEVGMNLGVSIPGLAAIGVSKVVMGEDFEALVLM